MKLPAGERAEVDPAKLSAYALNPDHPVGKHKARVFAAALGITLADAEMLRRRLLDAARVYDCVPTKANEHGRTFEMDFQIVNDGRSALVRAVWIIRDWEDFPRLVTVLVV